MHMAYLLTLESEEKRNMLLCTSVAQRQKYPNKNAFQ